MDTFLAIETLWRWDGMTGRCLGLDYPGVEAALRMRRVRDRRRMFEQLQAMERKALAVFNKPKAGKK